MLRCKQRMYCHASQRLIITTEIKRRENVHKWQLAILEMTHCSTYLHFCLIWNAGTNTLCCQDQWYCLILYWLHFETVLECCNVAVCNLLCLVFSIQFKCLLSTVWKADNTLSCLHWFYPNTCTVQTGEYWMHALSALCLKWNVLITTYMFKY